jgi:hypothetical protein
MPSELQSGLATPAKKILWGVALRRDHHTVTLHPALMTADDHLRVTPLFAGYRLSDLCPARICR